MAIRIEALWFILTISSVVRPELKFGGIKNPVITIDARFKQCEEDKQLGVCVPFAQCILSDSTLSSSGSVHSTEERDKKCNLGSEICCKKFDELCVWCVNIYRNEIDSKYKGPFCAGVLIGTKVVLTTATCVLAGNSYKNVWVTQPISKYPSKAYEVVKAMKHPRYVSAYHRQDFGLMILGEDVEWIRPWTDPWLDFDYVYDWDSLECTATGYNDSGDLEFSKIRKIQPGRCNKRRTRSLDPGVNDDKCAIANSTCTSRTGSIVLCYEDKWLKGVGLVKKPCSGGGILFGSFAESRDWLREELEKLKVDNLIKKVLDDNE